MSGIWDAFVVQWIIYLIFVLESNRALAIALKTALFGFYISLPARAVKYVKLYPLWVMMKFIHGTRVCKFYTSFTFCEKENSFHIFKKPIIVIKPAASLKRDFVAKIFLVDEFCTYGVCAYLKCSNL